MEILKPTDKRVLKSSDLQKMDLKPVKFTRNIHKKLNSSTCIPSTMYMYSMCIGYIQHWFLSNFPDGYFKSVFVEGKHALEEFKRPPGKLVKIPKPALSIIPQPNWDFDNENLNWDYGTRTNFISMTSDRDVFFKDSTKGLFIGVRPDLLLVDFNFRAKVNTRAKQIDLYRYMQMSLGTDDTIGEYVTMDFHFPYDLALQIANDAGFSINNNKITDILGFLKYLNSHSNVPFTYKIRKDKNINEFFIRHVNYIHIRKPTDIQIDDGERQGQISSNYIAEYQVQVRFPAPRYFRYFSSKAHQYIKSIDDDGNIRAYFVNYNAIPERNIKNWELYFTIDYEDDAIDKPLEIDLFEVIDGSDLKKVIDFVKEQALSPALFVDIHLYNKQSEIPIKINWDKYKLYTVGLVLDHVSRLAVYIDKEYVNTQINNINEFYSNRLK